MTENSSVYALVGTLLPNQKDPPSGGTFSKLVKSLRNGTQSMRDKLAHSWSTFHSKTPWRTTAEVSLPPGFGWALP